MANRFDAIIIGTGQSGPSLARRLAESGRTCTGWIAPASRLARHSMIAAFVSGFEVSAISSR